MTFRLGRASKVYEVIPDEAGARSGYLESSMNRTSTILYTEAYFVLITLPQDAVQIMTTVKRRNLS
jgi:hypothetical protein